MTAGVLLGLAAVLRVPSAVADDEFNSVMDPAHPEMVDVRNEDIRPYARAEAFLRRFRREA
jgi:hypothetical protein